LAPLTPAEASNAIEASLQPLPPEHVPLAAAAGRVLREDLYAERDQPPFDRVAMDGIAVRSAAVEQGYRSFRITGVVAAGARPSALTDAQTCLEAMTGAVLPPGADAIVPVEAITVANNTATLPADISVTPWMNVHRRGLDATSGSLTLARGTRLRGPELAAAASTGCATVAVTREPRIAVISTGDELVPPGEPLEDWQIRRSNAYGIIASLRTHGYGELTDDHVRDDPAVIARALETHLAANDVLILSGGVSAGRFDHVPGVLAALGVRKVFHKVAQRPGKPFWFGVGPTGQAVFALPGNPVSTLVCLVRYALPALARLGAATPGPPATVTLDTAQAAARHGLTSFLPVKPVIGHPNRVRIHATQGSGDFTALIGTLGFVELAPGHSYDVGALVPVYTWG